MRTIIFILPLFVANVSLAQVAFAGGSASATTTAGNDISHTHTPTSTPRGALVFVFYEAATDQVPDAPTYGGVTMTHVAGSPNIKATSETGGVNVYFLGSSIPTGAQTVFVEGSASTVSRRSICLTVTASTDTEIVDADGTINSSSIADPSVTLSLSGRTSWAALSFMSGQDATSGTTPLTNWQGTNETDFGTTIGGVYRYSIIGTTDITAGWTQTADDAVMVAVSVSEKLPRKAYIIQ